MKTKVQVSREMDSIFSVAVPLRFKLEDIIQLITDCSSYWIRWVSLLCMHVLQIIYILHPSAIFTLRINPSSENFCAYSFV